MSEKRVFGIDLGTTYSCIAYVDDFGKAVVCKDAEASSVLAVPSVVLFESVDNIVVGNIAKESADKQDSIVSFVKRSMGNPNAQWTYDGITHRPEAISSFILKRLRDNAKTELGVGNDDVKDAVITCPAYFGDNERKATQKAGELAGLNVLNVISEPTAAAIFYGLTAGDESKDILVYDLGGGTFDVTFLSIKPGEIEEICTKGNHQLGGKDWDERLFNQILNDFNAVNPDNGIAEDPELEYGLLLKTEKAKQELSGKEDTKVREGRDSVIVTREKFEELTKDLLDQTIALTKEVIEFAKSKGHGKVDEIILVGGSTRMKQVPDAIQSSFGIEPKMLDPDLAVAKGAALFAKDLADTLKINKLLVDKGVDPVNVDVNKPLEEQPQEIQVAASSEPELKKMFGLSGRNHTNIIRITSKSFGVKVTVNEETNEERIANIIIAQTKVPQEKSETFSVQKDNQIGVDIEVYENEMSEETVELLYGRLIGKAEITGLPSGLKAGTPVNIQFKLTDDARLFLFGECQGKTVEAVIETTAVMSKEEEAEWKEKTKGIAISG